MLVAQRLARVNSDSDDTGARLGATGDGIVRGIQVAFRDKLAQQEPSRDSVVLALRTTEALYGAVQRLCYNRTRRLDPMPNQYNVASSQELTPRAVRNFCGFKGIPTPSALDLAAVCLQLKWKA